MLEGVFRIESRVQGSREIAHTWRRNQENGGGMLYDWGPHLIDQILYMVHSKVISVENLEQIKQDLDVLEILKKYYLPKNWNGFQIFTSKEETKFEDLQKVKQWLEEKDEEESL